MKIISHTSKPSESVARLLEELNLEDKVYHYGCGVSKLEQYHYFKDDSIPCPDWTVDPVVAQEWLEDDSVVMCRQRIKGQTGIGIVVCKPGEELPEAKVYTKYISHKREFRVNLFNHTLVNVREKKKQLGSKGSFYIRNLENGYTTAKCSNYPPALIDLAIKASMVSESSFIGVDVGYNELKDFLFVIEVNSGPTIEGSSVVEYADAIRADLNKEEDEGSF